MSDRPVQVIVAAFNSPDAASALMADLKQGKKAGLIGITEDGLFLEEAEITLAPPEEDITVDA